MKMNILQMKIVEETEYGYLINIEMDGFETEIIYSPDEKKLVFVKEDSLSEFLIQNEYQFRQLLQTKKRDSYYEGFVLRFCIRDQKNAKAFNDREKIVAVDKRNGCNTSYVIEYDIENIEKIYIDASFLEKRGSAGIAILHQDIQGDYHLYTEKSDEKSSSLLELIAAVRGIEIFGGCSMIRIVTDSQYVRKGLTEWIFNWKLNDWRTTNGKKVKNISWWKKFDDLTKEKYVEFEWVKGHSEHFENTICDMYAKEAANST